MKYPEIILSEDEKNNRDFYYDKRLKKVTHYPKYNQVRPQTVKRTNVLKRKQNVKII